MWQINDNADYFFFWNLLTSNKFTFYRPNKDAVDDDDDDDDADKDNANFCLSLLQKTIKIYCFTLYSDYNVVRI